MFILPSKSLRDVSCFTTVVLTRLEKSAIFIIILKYKVLKIKMTQKTLCKSLLFIFILSLDEGMYTFEWLFLFWLKLLNTAWTRDIISFINQNNVSWRFHITTWHNLTIGSYQGLSWCMHWIKFFLLGRHKTILGNK